MEEITDVPKNSTSHYSQNFEITIQAPCLHLRFSPIVGSKYSKNASVLYVFSFFLSLFPSQYIEATYIVYTLTMYYKSSGDSMKCVEVGI